MKCVMQIQVNDDKSTWIKKGEGFARRVCFISDAIALCKKTRRHIYRYVSSGVIENYGKFAGEWLLDYQSVLNLSGLPLQVQPIPRRFEPLFPEYEITKLNVGRDRIVVISRILDFGTISELKWLLKRYSREEIKSFLIKDGGRLLSPRSLNFWTMFFNVEYKKVSWRDNRNSWRG